MQHINQSKPTKLEWLGLAFVVVMFFVLTFWAIEVLVDMQ